MGVGPLPSFFVTTSRPRVLAIQNDPTDPPLLVGGWLHESGIDVDVVVACESGQVPATVPAGVHGILALGGSMGANDDEDAPWLPAERALLRDAVAKGIPVMGLCLGSQLLAAATGGRVELAPRTEIGLSFVSPTEQGRKDLVTGAAVSALGERIPAIQWHQDHVAELPPAAQLLMTNDACRVQAFKVGESAYGFQCHPEIDTETFISWADFADEALARSGVDVLQASEDMSKSGEDLITAWRPVTHAWAELVHRAKDSEAESSA